MLPVKNSQILTPIKDQLHDSENRWFAVYTRYKSEKLVASNLAKKGIEAYVPLLRFTRKYTRKIKQVEIPLINCYVFVKISKQDYISVLQSEHVIGFLKIAKNMISIPDREIDILRWVVGENKEVSAREGNLKKGATVEVVAGKLTGLRGKIIKQKSKKFFCVALENIGFTLEIDISDEHLQLAKPISAAS